MEPIGNWINVGLANGPGDHSDEASSAFPVIREMVSPSTARAIVSIDHMTRANPPSDDGDDTVGFADLIPLARLVTGQWGPIGKTMKEIDSDGFSSAGRLAASIGTVRSNPKRLPMYQPDIVTTSWVDEPFWKRMKTLRDQLFEAEERAKSIYLARGVTDLRRQGWRFALGQCRMDVEWVLEHRAEAERGILRVVDRDGGGRAISVMGVEAPARAQFGTVSPREGSVRRAWGILAAKGNQKLPFVAYSTLPMSSCSGAGGCKVNLVNGRKEGYCYSFTAWRYPDSFARQFRNCLAEFVDRELAIIKGGGSDTRPSQWQARVEAAIRGRESRSWHSFVGDMAAAFLMPAIEDGQPAFMRIYVDGDVNSEDNILEWMRVCADLQRTRKDGANGKPAHPGVQAYGYSKCWDHFLALDRRSVSWPDFVTSAKSDPSRGGGKFAWPTNYALNLSADSVWNNENEASDDDRRRVTVAMAELPISRGYFRSIDLAGSLDALNAQFDPKTGELRSFAVPSADKTPFPFKADRIIAIADMNRAMDVAALRASTGASSRKDLAEALKAAFLAMVKKYSLEDFVPKQAIYQGAGAAREKVGEKYRFALPKGKYEKGNRKGKKKSDDDYASEFSGWLLSQLYKAWFAFLYTNAMTGNSDESAKARYGDFGRITITELARDEADFAKGALDPENYLSEKKREKMHEAVEKALEKAREGKGGTLSAAEENAVRKVAESSSAEEFHRVFARSKGYQSKALAVALHEVLWTFNLGGSCPLVCGNCYDTPTVPQKGTEEYLNARHRCASMSGFKGRTVFIGRH